MVTIRKTANATPPIAIARRSFSESKFRRAIGTTVAQPFPTYHSRFRPVIDTVIRQVRQGYFGLNAEGTVRPTCWTC